MATPRRSTTTGNDVYIIKGIETELDPSMVLHLNGKTYTPAQLAAFVRRRLYLHRRINKSKALWLSAIAKYAAHEKELNLVLGELRVQVFGLFGRESPKVKSFTFAPPKKPVRTAEQKKQTAAKARATREARGTKGRRARLEIKGTVEAPPAAEAAPPEPDDSGFGRAQEVVLEGRACSSLAPTSRSPRWHPCTKIIEDGSTDGSRTAMGALALLVIIAVVIGIGQFMTGNGSTPAR